MSKSVLEAVRLVTSWNQCHGAPYRVVEADLRWNLGRQDWLDYQTVTIAGVPALVAEASAKGAEAGISGKTLWLSLYGEIPAGEEAAFCAAFVHLTRERGKTRAQVGGEEFHFVAGVPIDEAAGARAAAAFREGGFQAYEAADFSGQLHDPKITAYVAEAEAAAKKLGCKFRTAESAEEKDQVGRFLLREFPGRWEREFRFWRDHADTSRGFWNILAGGDDKMIGFSRLAVRGRLDPLDEGWTPGALRLPLFPANTGRRHLDSCLGPIGISASERGRGAGKILLGLSLKHLLLNKADTLCIDWTNAYNYYIPLGVSFVRKFQSIWKEL
jgi:hypothetical protein